jgi:hypothetical protein
MAVIDLAETSSVLGILRALCSFWLAGLSADVSLVSHESVCERRWDRHLAMVIVDGCAFVLLVAAGPCQDCTQPNIMMVIPT